MKRMIVAGSALLALAALPAPAQAESDVYAGFPVTLKGYEGAAETSVSYGGQIARHVLHDSLKALAGKGTGAPDPALKAAMLAYFEGKEPGRAIIAPASKGPFAVKQTAVDEIGKGTNLAGKTYRGAVPGMPNNMTGPELVSFWIDKASAADKGFDAVNGYDYPQLISKFLIGAVFYNQAVDNYLDEKLRADTKPNDEPYKEGAAYTGKEHSWDEAFGYFGAPAHALALTPQAVYEIAKRGAGSEAPEDALAHADLDGDGAVDLRTEMTFAPAYYAAAFDRSGTGYLHAIVRAFLDGRRTIAAAEGAALGDAQRNALEGYAGTIRTNWEKVLAEAVFKYAGSVYKDLGTLEAILDSGGDPARAFRAYAKHWGELKGFALALQTGRDNLGETAVRLNRIIGFGPVLPNLSQVTDIDSQGNYVKDESKSLATYRYDMLKLQDLMVGAFAVEARQNDQLAELEALLDKLGEGASAEND